MAREERVDLDPLDVPLSRKDMLELLDELASTSDGPVSTVRHRQLAAVEQKLRAQWSEQPKPEKVTSSVVDEAHDS